MLINIATPEELIQEAEEIQSFLDVTPSEDANEAHERGNSLAAYISRTGKMLADAKYHLNNKKKSEIIETLVSVAKQTPNISTTAINELVKSVCRDEQFLVDMIERQNRTATHQIEWCRTVISKAKEEMRIAGMQRS